MMNPIKRVLVCSDLTEGSELVLAAGRELKQASDVEVDVLHVIELGFPWLGVLDEISITEVFPQQYFTRMRESLQKRLHDQTNRAGLKGKIFLREGQVPSVIAQVQEEEQYDIVVMGHGGSGIFQNLLGGVVQKVAASLKAPLLVVKGPLKLRKVAGLVDKSRYMDKIILSTLDFYRRFNCEDLEFISLWFDLPEPFFEDAQEGEPGEDLKEKVSSFLREGELPNFRIESTRELKVANHLVRILHQDEVDVAVMKRHRTGTLEKIYLGSETKRMLGQFSGNILICPP